MVIRKGEGATSRLKEVIAKAVGSQNVQIKTDSVILHVSNIDAITTLEEIKAAIQREVAEKEKVQVDIRSMRPAYGDGQIATVVAPAGVATVLLKKGRVNWLRKLQNKRKAKPRKVL